MRKSVMVVMVVMVFAGNIRSMAATIKADKNGIEVECNENNFDLEVSSSNEKISINTFERRLSWEDIFWGNVPYGKQYQITLKADGETVRLSDVRIGEESSTKPRVIPRNSSSGWRIENNHWFYYGSSGQKITGWLQYEGSWYYLMPDKNGEMCTKIWHKVEGEWYAFYPDGRMKANAWVESNNKWFFVGPSGTILKDQFVGPYHVNSTGVWDYTLAPQ